MLPPAEATVLVALAVAMPLVAAATTWVGHRAPTPPWSPRVVLLGDVVVVASAVLVAPTLRPVLAITLLPLVVAGVVSSRAPDILVVTMLGIGTWWGMVGAPVPSSTVLVATVGVTTLAVALQGQQLHRAMAGGSRRIAFLSGRSRALLHGVTEAVVVTTPSGRILDGNQPAIDLAGPMGLVGRACRDALRLRQDTALLDCDTCPLAATPGVDRELWVEAPDGERTTLLARVQPVVDRHGRTVELLHSFRDVSEIARARDAENTFLATASHELKTPLTVIQGSAETLLGRDSLPPDVQNQLLDAIVGKSAELDAMIGRLLEASRLRAGASDLDLGEVDLVELVARRAADLDMASPSHRFTARVVGHVPAARADVHAATTVIDHLLENARKYQPEGGEIEVTLDATDRDVILTVRDRGIGMTLEQQRRCFDRFWQARTGDRRRFGGTGVGLYLVREFVHAMGGRIEVESRVGRGTSFTVRLPRADWTPATATAPDVETVHGRLMIEEFMAQVGVGRAARRPGGAP